MKKNFFCLMMLASCSKPQDDSSRINTKSYKDVKNIVETPSSSLPKEETKDAMMKLFQNMIARSSPIGFDPGFTLARGSTVYPERANYFQSCPSEATGACHPHIPAGGGFYTIIAGQGSGVEQECLVNSMAPYAPNGENVGVPCPYTFYWNHASQGMDAQTNTPLQPKLAARMGINSVSFKNSNTNNLGFGVSAVIPANTYLGLNFNDDKMTPWYKDIHYVTFRVRARFCNTPVAADGFSLATFYTYLTFGNPQDHQKTYTLVWNLFELMNGSFSNPPFPRSKAVMNEAELGGTGAVDAKNVHINAKMAGLIPASVGYFVDRTSNCSTSIDSLPWTAITLDVRQTVQKMEAAGYLSSAELMQMKLSNQILGGGELYGRGMVEAEIRDFSLMTENVTPPPVWNGPGHPENHYVHTVTGNKFYSNGVDAFCWYHGTPPNNPPQIPTSIAPTLNNGGQCPWDQASNVPQGSQPVAGEQLGAGHYQHVGTGHKFYFNGTDAYCWFTGDSAPGPIMQTSVDANYIISKRNDGRCSWNIE